MTAETGAMVRTPKSTHPLRPASRLAPGAMVNVRFRDAVAKRVEASRGPHGDMQHFVELEYTDGHLPHSESLLWELERSATIPATDLPDVPGTPPMSPDSYLAFTKTRRWLHTLPYPAMPDVPKSLHPDESHPALLAPSASHVTPLPHQLVPLVQAMKQPRIRLLIADDVGMGKTVEAGLIIKELFLRRRIRRVLVLCPPGLRRQWQEEMNRHFDLPFHILDQNSLQRLRSSMGSQANPFHVWSLIIASPHFLKTDPVKNLLLTPPTQTEKGRRPFDVLIVDEAHHFLPQPHAPESDLTTMLRQVAPWFEHRLFLTATPHNGFRRSFTSLLEILDPLRFRTTAVPTSSQLEAMKEVVIRRTRKQISPPRRKLRALHELPVFPSGKEQALLDSIADFQQFLRSLSGTPASVMAPALSGQTLAKRLLSSPRAFRHTWLRFQESASKEVPVESVPAGWSRRMESIDAQLGSWIPDDGALEVEDSRFATFAQWLKEHLLAGNRWNGDERCVVFTEYRHTLEYLEERLRLDYPELSEQIITLHGQLLETTRRKRVKQFVQGRSRKAILLSTDAGSEGLNLQHTARLLYHYDLPWNPARVEQRTGRLDRHQQRRQVQVFLPHTDHPLELELIDRLSQKQDRVSDDVGPFNPLPAINKPEQPHRTILFPAVPHFQESAPALCNIPSHPGASLWHRRLDEHLRRTPEDVSEVSRKLLSNVSLLGPVDSATSFLSQLEPLTLAGAAGITRWTATTATLPKGTDAALLWTLHAKAFNTWGEIVHDWSSTLYTPLSCTPLGWRIIWRNAYPPALVGIPTAPLIQQHPGQSWTKSFSPSTIPSATKTAQFLWPQWQLLLWQVPLRVGAVLTRQLTSTLWQEGLVEHHRRTRALEQSLGELKTVDLRSKRPRLEAQLRRLETQRKSQGYLFLEHRDEHLRFETEIRQELSRRHRIHRSVKDAFTLEKGETQQRADAQRWRLRAPVQVCPEALCIIIKGN